VAPKGETHHWRRGNCRVRTLRPRTSGTTARRGDRVEVDKSGQTVKLFDKSNALTDSPKPLVFRAKKHAITASRSARQNVNRPANLALTQFWCNWVYSAPISLA
jgi:hypothetical protein